MLQRRGFLESTDGPHAGGRIGTATLGQGGGSSGPAAKVQAGGSNAPIALVQDIARNAPAALDEAADWNMTSDGGISSMGLVKKELLATEELMKEVVNLLKAIFMACVGLLFVLILVLLVILVK